MTGNDLIVVAPWIIFGAGLSVVWIRLLQSRRASRHQPERSPPPVPDPAGSGGAEPGRCGRGDVPAAPRRASAGQERLQEVTELSLAYHGAAAADPDGHGNGDGDGDGSVQQATKRLLRRTVAARRKLANVEEALA